MKLFKEDTHENLEAKLWANHRPIRVNLKWLGLVSPEPGVVALSHSGKICYIELTDNLSDLTDKILISKVHPLAKALKIENEDLGSVAGASHSPASSSWVFSRMISHADCTCLSAVVRWPIIIRCEWFC